MGSLRSSAAMMALAAMTPVVLSAIVLIKMTFMNAASKAQASLFNSVEKAVGGVLPLRQLLRESPQYGTDRVEWRARVDWLL